MADEGEAEEDLEIVFDAADQSEGCSLNNSTKKRSHVWNFFEVASFDSKLASCKICKAKISRGGAGKKASTYPLRNHLRLKHKKQFQEMTRREEEKAASTSKACASQPTLKTTIDNLKVWDRKGLQAQDMDYAIGEMIALDNEPYSVVEKSGFKRLMLKAQPRYAMPGRNYFTDKIIPDIYNRCLMKIRDWIDLAKHLSFTSDIWTLNSNDSFISLSAHWVNVEFELKNAVLCVRNFPGSHKGEAIATILSKMLSEWKVEMERFHLILIDNAANIVKGANDAKLPKAHCFLHSLQLVIKDSIDSQRMVSDTIAVCRRIVSHFNHSPLACEKLKDLQRELKMNTNKLLQDVPTRWNSTYYMLESVYLQKRSLALFATDEQVTALTKNQWSLLESTLSLLQPFEEVTKMMSKTESCISEVIPAVATLQRYLEKENTLHAGVGTMKILLKESILKRFGPILENQYYITATALDPRYKLALFQENLREAIKDNILQEILPKDSSNGQISQDGDELAEESLRQENHSSYWSCFSEFGRTNAGTLDNSGADLNSLFQTEVNLYFSTPLLERKESPFAWWKKNHLVYPNLSNLVSKYLPAPASTVYSERLFSETGNIYEDARNRLTPQHAESLAFLHHNLKLLNFKY